MKSFALLLAMLVCTLLYGQQDTLALDVEFSHPGGPHEGTFELSLSAPNGAAIFYSLDGTVPNNWSTPYTAPILVDTVVIIRARAYLNGKAGKLATRSYFPGRKHTLPIVSVVTDPINLFDSASGIYAKGYHAAEKYPYFGANFWRDWEKEANIELYETDGTMGINQLAGIKIFGGWSRPLAQKSLALYARKKKYGKKWFKYPVFPEKSMKKYKSLILRNSGSDFTHTQFRDALLTHLTAGTGLAIQAYRPVVVYLNGQYWGIQNIREKINKAYFETNFGVDGENIDLMEHRDDRREGDRVHYKALKKFLRLHDLAIDSNFAYVQTLMNTENYKQYNIAQTYFDNRDAGGNIRYWRPRTDTGRWEWVLFDTDFGFGLDSKTAYKTNTLAMFTNPNGPKWPSPPWSTFLIRKLLENPTFKQEYINQFADNLNSIYHPTTVNHMIDSFQTRIRTEMPFHIERWKLNAEAWERRVNRMREFARLRPHHIRQHLIEKFELTDTAVVTINATLQGHGTVQLNSLTLDTFPWTGVYFKGVPIALSATPDFGYSFNGWQEGGTESSLQINPSGQETHTAIFEKNAHSPYQAQVVINEICYTQDSARNSGDWVELFNRSDTAVDVSGWLFKDGDPSRYWQIHPNTTIPGKGYLVLCRYEGTFKTVYSDTLLAVGDFDFGLSSNGEAIMLYDPQQQLIDSVAYLTEAPWPVPEGTTRVIGLNDPYVSGNIAHWGVSEGNGTPGSINAVYQQTLNRIAEEERQQLMLMAGGGGLVVVLLLTVMWRRKKKRAA